MKKSPRPSHSKIKSQAQLRSLVKKLRAKKQQVVFTNGVFDIIHKGHVSYLERARRLGDVLIVALNSDASTKRLKGATRPINPLADRLEVIAALESVDFVTWFGEDTPIKPIVNIAPSVLVKGGDWQISKMVGAPEVLASGGQVKTLPFIRGRSTSEIIRKAQKKR